MNLKKVHTWVISGLAIFPVLIVLGGIFYVMSAGKVNFFFWMIIPSIIFEETLESCFYELSNNTFLNLIFVIIFWFSIGAVTEIISKKGTFLGEPIDIRGCIDLRSVGTDGLEGMVIRKDKQNIRIS